MILETAGPTASATSASALTVRSRTASARPLRVLLVHFTELRGLGGVKMVVLRLAEKLTELGCAAGIVELPVEWRAQRFVLPHVPLWGVAAPSYPSIGRPRSWASLVRSTLQFLHVTSQFRPDVVHVHFPMGQCLPVVGAHVVPHRWRLVVTVHNSEIRVGDPDRPGLRRWQERLFQRADAVTAVSRGLLDDAVTLFPCIASKGSVVHNGISEAWFRSPSANRASGRPFVLFVGRLDRVKGVDVLLNAWARVRQRVPGVELLLAGDGSQRETLESLAVKRGIAGSVEFVGVQSEDELPPLYAKAQVVVLPSRREGLPLTLLEAGACGAVTVASRIPGNEDVVQDGRTGYLVAPDSEEELADAIVRVLEQSPHERQRMRTAATARIREEFSEAATVAGYMDVFSEVRSREPRFQLGLP